MLDRRAFVTSCLVGGLAGLTACAKKSDTTSDAQGSEAGGSLSFFITNPLAIDPYNAGDSEGRQVQSALFESLTVYDWQEGVLKCAAASSWDSNEDETEFTFHLVKDATFHNGEKVTAQSFKRAWERICDPTMDPPSTIRYHLDPVVGAEEMASGKATELEGVKAVDDFTLVVTLKAPMADFPYVCSHSALAPVPQAALDDPDAYMMAPIGNGPFKMDGVWMPGQRIRLVRYDDFHGEPAMLHCVEFSILENPAKAFGEFEAGHVDFTPIAAGKFGEVSMHYGMSEDGYTVTPEGRTLTGSQCSLYCLVLNCEDEVLSDPDVRRALSLAIDRQNIIHTVYGDTCEPADSVVPSSLDDDPGLTWEDSHYDAEAAKALLDKKYPVGEGGLRKLSIDLWFNSDGGHGDIIKLVEEDLKKVGISVSQSSTGWTAYKDALEKGSFQIARFGWFADYPIVDNFLYPLFYSNSEENYSRYVNEEVDKALLAARQIPDEEERRQAYREVCVRIGRDMPIIPLFFSSHNHVGSKRVERLYYDPQGKAHFEDALVS